MKLNRNKTQDLNGDKRGDSLIALVGRFALQRLQQPCRKAGFSISLCPEVANEWCKKKPEPQSTFSLMISYHYVPQKVSLGDATLGISSLPVCNFEPAPDTFQEV